jgi:hypothetical protein
MQSSFDYRDVMDEAENRADGRSRVIMSRVVRHKQHDDRSFDIEFWQRVGVAGRFAAAWQMIRDVQRMRGQSGELPDMQKNVTRVIRRSQEPKPSGC